jgi:hypothetical protein
LSSKSNNSWVLNQILWGKVSDFLLGRAILFNFWEHFSHFLLAQFSDISNVVESFNLFQMHKIMNHPELIIVVHSSVQRFHGFGSGSTLGDGTIDSKFSLHKIVIFSLDLSNNIFSMDRFLERSPVDWLKVSSSGGGLAIEVQNGLKLRVLFSSSWSV